MPNDEERVDWRNLLQRWPIGVVGEFLGTVKYTNARARAARRWLRRLFLAEAEGLALASILIKKGIITKQEYEESRQSAARVLCEALEDEFPGIRANEIGVTLSNPKVSETMADWPK